VNPLSQDAPSPTYSPLPPVLSTEQAASLLGCEPEQIKYLASRNQLPGAKVGRGWIFHAEALMAHLRRLCEANLEASNVPLLEAPLQPTKAPERTSEALKTPKGVPLLGVPAPPRRRGRPRTPYPSLGLY